MVAGAREGGLQCGGEEREGQWESERAQGWGEARNFCNIARWGGEREGWWESERARGGAQGMVGERAGARGEREAGGRLRLEVGCEVSLDCEVGPQLGTLPDYKLGPRWGMLLDCEWGLQKEPP